MGIKRWEDAVKFVVDQYNDTEHTTTEVTPNYAATDKYIDIVKRIFRKRQRLTESTTKYMKAIRQESTKSLDNMQNLVSILIIGKQVMKQ